MITQEKRFYGIADIAKLFGVTRLTVHRWLSQGEFPDPDIKFKRTHRWKAESIDAWVASQATATHT
jgi:predicted DNA-binding transcriptional regulator AlpA